MSGFVWTLSSRMKKLGVLILLLLTGTASTDQNLALRGKATQAHRFEHVFGAADSAIDGNRDSNYNKGSCTHTVKMADPWWRLDLLQTYVVTAVVITNRQDCCKESNPERLHGAEIHIGDSPENDGNTNARCGVISKLEAGAVAEFQCNGMDGRYVIIIIPDREEFLTLCEVEVYGSPLAR
uniref:Fucolectin tachylectin-4 pentraxin-1 domain-containing protein n=1 Tax=Salarias fasciatus TaxID=181472 RepID=A0A672HYC0_SALFA